MPWRLVTGTRLLIALVLLAFALAPRPVSHAQVAVDPSVFALLPSDFPAGSTIMVSEVADNVTVAVQHLENGPAPSAARLTGYYMRASARDANGNVRVLYAFLASIYTDPTSARAAFAQQDAYWAGLLHQFPTQVVVEAVQSPPGETGQVRWYALRDVNGNTHSELLFQRGPYFIQVTADTFFSPLGSADLQAMLHVGLALDAIAASGRPEPTATATATATATFTVTPTFTPTGTPTSTPTSTATPTQTPIRPTATATLVKPIQEPSSGSTKKTPTSKPQKTPTTKKPIKCPKGYKLVKGKCKKGHR